MIESKLYMTPEAIIGACAVAISLAPSKFPPDLPTTPLLSGAPGWYDFEHQAWPIGEAIRQSLKAKPKLRQQPSVCDAIVGVVTHLNLRRGRQSFVMALGYTAAASCAPKLAELLGDPDINGQIIDALLKMHAPGYSQQVATLTSHNQAWIRRLAKRYIERYGLPPNHSFQGTTGV